MLQIKIHAYHNNYVHNYKHHTNNKAYYVLNYVNKIKYSTNNKQNVKLNKPAIYTKFILLLIIHVKIYVPTMNYLLKIIIT